MLAVFRPSRLVRLERRSSMRQPHRTNSRIAIRIVLFVSQHYYRIDANFVADCHRLRHRYGACLHRFSEVQTEVY